MGNGQLGMFGEQHYVSSTGMGCISSMQCEDGIGLNHIYLPRSKHTPSLLYKPVS